MVGIAQVFGQPYGLFHRAAGVGRHEVGHDVLLHALLLVDPFVFLHKLLVYGVRGLAHHAQHLIGHVLRRDLQLAGDVIAHQLLEKRVARVGQQIVEPDAAADEDLLDARQLAELPQQGQVIRMVGDQVFTGGREQALPCRARAALQLLFAGGLAEIRRRAADVMDVALEARRMRHALGFPEDRLLRAGLDDPPLMERQRAEAACAVAAPAGGQAEFDLRDGRNAAKLFVRWVERAAVRKIVDMIHFLLRKRLLRRVLDEKFMVAIRLDEPLGAEGVGVAVLDRKTLGVDARIFLHIREGRERDGRDRCIRLTGLIDRAVDIRDVLRIHAVVERVRDLDDGALPHAVDQKIGLRIE